MSSARGYQFSFSCRKCGNGNQSTFKANSLGGAPTRSTRACGGCGAAVDGSPKFCPDCGRPFAA